MVFLILNLFGTQELSSISCPITKIDIKKENYGVKKKMQVITINLPEKYLEVIQTLMENIIYHSRSKTIRTALKEYLIEDFRVSDGLDNIEKIISASRGRKL